VQADSSGAAGGSGPGLGTLLPLPRQLAPPATPAESTAQANRAAATVPSGERWILGLDGGATKTLAAAYEVGSGRMAYGESGPSNPNSAGFEAAATALAEAVHEALHRAAADPDHVLAAVLAVASVDTEDVQKHLLSEIPALRTVESAFMTNDVVAAWASGTWGQPGVAAISGTGSNVFGVGVDGETWRCGGWDYLLGDEGAGVWIGLEAMRRATRWRDGRAPHTALVDRLCEVYDMADVAELHEIVYQRLQKADIAAFAVHVAEVAGTGDPVAVEILGDAGRLLAEQIVTVIRRVRLPDEFPVALVGSSYKAGPLMLDPLVADVLAVAPGAHIQRPEIPPVGGSLWLAARAAGLEGTLDPARLAAALERSELPEVDV
jgi:N-acetylglucosamine kinase-like BadF-type ATPase